MNSGSIGNVFMLPFIQCFTEILEERKYIGRVIKEFISKLSYNIFTSLLTKC